MIALLSPAKTLNTESDLRIGGSQIPFFVEDAALINNKLRKLSRKKLMDLQSISADLAAVNHHRNQMWNSDHSDEARQAALMFQGDVYLGLEASKWTPEDMEYASQHILILSGLYGVLKPSDLIRAYRLEMGTRLPSNNFIQSAVSLPDQLSPSEK